MTFVAIIPPKSEDPTLTYVNLYQYTPRDNIKKLKSEALKI